MQTQKATRLHAFPMWGAEPERAGRHPDRGVDASTLELINVFRKSRDRRSANA